MQYLTSILFLIFCWVHVLPAQVQDARVDFENINSTYQSFSKLKTEVEYVLFPTHTSTQSYQTQKASFWQDGDKFLYKIAGIETLSTPERFYFIDHEAKQLIVNRPSPIRPDPLTGLALDTLLSVCQQIKKSKTQQLTSYELSLPFGEIEKVKIMFDPHTFLMKKVIMFYRITEAMEPEMPKDKPRLEIHYLSQNPRAVFPTGTFSESRYVQIQNGQRNPIPTYQNYEFIDYTNIK